MKPGRDHWLGSEEADCFALKDFVAVRALGWGNSRVDLSLMIYTGITRTVKPWKWEFCRVLQAAFLTQISRRVNIGQIFA